MKVSFNVVSEEMRDKTALVFLKPQNSQRNDQIHAWQLSRGVPGTTESFVYDHQMSIDVRRDGADDMKITSERQPASPSHVKIAVFSRL